MIERIEATTRERMDDEKGVTEAVSALFTQAREKHGHAFTVIKVEVVYDSQEPALLSTLTLDTTASR